MVENLSSQIQRFWVDKRHPDHDLDEMYQWLANRLCSPYREHVHLDYTPGTAAPLLVTIQAEAQEIQLFWRHLRRQASRQRGNTTVGLSVRKIPSVSEQKDVLLLAQRTTPHDLLDSTQFPLPPHAPYQEGCLYFFFTAEHECLYIGAAQKERKNLDPLSRVAEHFERAIEKSALGDYRQAHYNESREWIIYLLEPRICEAMVKHAFPSTHATPPSSTFLHLAEKVLIALYRPHCNITGNPLKRYRHKTPGPRPPLSPHLQEILNLQQQGYSKQAIAQQFGLKPSTVRRYLTLIKERLDGTLQQ